jgi:hypothetical protein
MAQARSKCARTRAGASTAVGILTLRGEHERAAIVRPPPWRTWYPEAMSQSALLWDVVGLRMERMARGHSAISLMG